MREWAASSGHQLSERGRIPQHIIEAYEKGQNAPAPQPAKAAKSSKAAVSTPTKAAKRTPRRKAPAVQFKAS
ncbi:histone-like nucleoid-structuring protein Lsr2 [Actinoplanes sp. NPDC051859]|uniref:Lsr2 family DNA-binding protein n=1 Tax=Actinoplanes sp. NPDC051859 TaxID=3363909 RepID=UPI003795B257